MSNSTARSRLIDENYRVALRSNKWRHLMDVMIYGRVRRIDASVDIDPVNDNGRFYPTDSCELAGAVKIASNCVRHGRAR